MGFGGTKNDYGEGDGAGIFVPIHYGLRLMLMKSHAVELGGELAGISGPYIGGESIPLKTSLKYLPSLAVRYVYVF